MPKKVENPDMDETEGSYAHDKEDDDHKCYCCSESNCYPSKFPKKVRRRITGIIQKIIRKVSMSNLSKF